MVKGLKIAVRANGAILRASERTFEGNLVADSKF